ncbi:MAG TPA: HDIG domain-containing protein [Thermoleophilia bacterium]|nr:HDIG domain-containing protein [Thermoleophilia bacterium]
MTLTREAVVALVQERVANENLRRHMLATESIMRAVAERLGEDVEAWGLAGLGHDLDSEQTEDDFTRHGREAADLLAAAGASDDVVHAVAAHNPATGEQAQRPIDVALIASDQLGGLVTAAALVRPDKELEGVQVKSLRKRFREGAFARGVDRASIQRCEELGIPLDDFFALGLAAMQGIAPDLGM